MLDTTHTTEPARRPPSRGANAQPLQVAQIPDALLKLKTVCALTGLSPASIYRKTEAGTFPQPLRMGSRCTRWRAGDVSAWLSAVTAAAKGRPRRATQ